MSRLFVFLVGVILVEYVLGWALAHFGVVVLGGCSWWAWSLWQGRRRA